MAGRLAALVLVALLVPAETTLGQTGTAQSSVATNAPSMVSVYVASPLGFDESTKLFMNQVLVPLIKRAGVNAINPWDANSQIDAQISAAKKIEDLNARRKAWAGVTQQLGRANAVAIENADGIVAVLDGVDVDSGTASEIGYGAALGKWIIGYRGDFRRTGEDETSDVNLQVEYFIRKNGGVLVHNLRE